MLKIFILGKVTFKPAPFKPALLFNLLSGLTIY